MARYLRTSPATPTFDTGNVIKTAHDPHPLPLLPSSPNLTLSLDLSDKYGMVAVTVFEILESLQQLPVKLVRLRGLHLNPNTGKPKFLLAKEHEEIEQRCAAHGARCVWPAQGSRTETCLTWRSGGVVRLFGVPHRSICRS